MLSVLLAQAQEQPTIALDITSSPQWGKLASLTPGSVVSGLIRLVLLLAALLFFFMLVFGGIQWIVSGGDKAKSEESRKRITSALVGLAIVFAAWAIAQLIKTLFGVDIFILTIPSLLP